MNRLFVLMVALAVLASCSNGQTQSSDQWTKTSDIHPQPNQVSRLTPDQLNRVKKLQGDLSEVDPSSVDEWVDDFQKDRNPESEIRLWESIASAYRRYSSTHTLTIQGKREVLNLLLLRSETANEAQILKHAGLKVLNSNQAHEVLAEYKGKTEPVTVEMK